MATGTPVGTGILRSLALFFLFLSWEMRIPRCSAGPSTNSLDLLVRTSHTETSAVTAGVRTSSEGASQNAHVPETSGHLPPETQHGRTETSVGTFTLTSTAGTRDTKSIFPETETQALTKTIPYQFKVVVTNSLETLAISDSMAISETATALTGSELTKSIFDTLCTSESTEEVKMVTTDISVLAHTSAEAEGLISESSASSDVFSHAITVSPALEPGSTDPVKVRVAYTITSVEVTNCSVTETDTSANVSGPSGTDHSPTKGVAALSNPEISASPDSMESAYITETTTSSETISTSSTIGTTGDIPLTTKDTTDRDRSVRSDTPGTTGDVPLTKKDTTDRDTSVRSDTPGTTGDVPLTTKDTTDRDTSVRSGTPGTTGDVPLTTKDTTDGESSVKTSTHSGPVVSVRTQFWKEILSFSVGTSSHIEISETVTITTEAESTISKASTPVTFSATVHGPSEVVTIKNSTSSETFTTDNTTSRIFSTSRDPVPTVHLITANSSQRANITVSMTTASSRPLRSNSTTRRKPSTAVPSTTQTQLTTRGAAEEDGGVLLLQLSVVSPEDLTDPRVTERLIRQIGQALRAHKLPVPVSLLRVSMS